MFARERPGFAASAASARWNARCKAPEGWGMMAVRRTLHMYGCGVFLVCAERA
jgi:hypothetical protein